MYSMLMVCVRPSGQPGVLSAGATLCEWSTEFQNFIRLILFGQPGVLSAGAALLLVGHWLLRVSDF